MTTDTKRGNKAQLFQFSAINKVLDSLVPTPSEKNVTGNKYVSWGERNDYPEYLWSLYNDVTTLKTVVEGIVDYVAGNSIMVNNPKFSEKVNQKGDTITDLIKNITRDYLIYGGFAINVIRNNAGEVAELFWLDMRHIRTDADNQAFWYSKEWAKKWGRTGKALVLPKFIPDAKTVASSVFFVRNAGSTVYPIPRYSGAIKCCEIERQIDQLHLSGLSNGFMPSFLISFNNGIPDDESKAQIEKEIYEKFVSTDNAGRVLLSFSNGKDNATTIEAIKVEDFGEKYKAAATRSREQIYAAFRAIPALFGIMSESTGFNEQEFEQAYKLFNKTVVRPLQIGTVDTFDKILGMKGSITMDPFSLNDTDTDVN